MSVPADAKLARRLSALWPLPLGFAVASVLIVAGALLFFAHPLGDDFCNAANVRELGVLGTVRSEYLNWGGRWASHVFVVGFPALVELTRGYPLGLLLVAGAGVLALRSLLGSVLPLEGERRLAWSLTLALVALHWAGMPHPGQSVYWLEGASIYSLNVSLCMLLVAGLIRLPEAPSLRRTAAVVGLAALALVVAAFHELFALLLAGILLAGAAVAWRFRDRRAWAWAAAGAGALVGLASVVLAPGNAARQDFFPQAQDPVRAVSQMLAMWLRVLDAPVGRGGGLGSYTPLGWVLDPKLLAATLLFATAPRLRSLRPAWFAREPRLWKWLIPLLGLGALSGSFLAGGWALGRTLPLRAFNGLYMVFLLGWFLTLFVHTRGESPSDERAAGVRILRVASALVLALALLASTNFKYAVRDLGRGWAASFDRAMELRYERARRLAASGVRELDVEPIEPWPSSYFRSDIGDISPPLQQCVARYFGLDTLRAEPSPSNASRSRKSQQPSL